LDILIEDIDIILLTKLYIYYLITTEDTYILKYLNQYSKKICTDIKKTIKKTISNYSIIDNFVNKYKLELGCFAYDHIDKIYSWIEFCNDDTIFVISNYESYYIHNCEMIKKNNIIFYDPENGKICEITKR